MTEFKAARPANRLRLDKWAFFIALIIGVAIIVKLNGSVRTKIDAVVACVAILIAYAGMVTRVPALKLRIDQAADNCYYLGLLFTLTSLGVALFSFSTEGASQTILNNFGVAIFTTIAGLGLRVLISQFREDPEDLERVSREALAETVRRLRGELDQSVAELQRFAEGVRQALQETTEAARSNTTDTLSAAINRFEEALATAAQSFNANTTGFNKRASTINTSLDKVTSAVDSLSSRIASVRADEGLVREALEPAFAGLTAAVAGFAVSLENQRERFDTSLAQLSRFSDALIQFESSTGSLTKASTDLQASIAALRDGPGQVEHLAAAIDATARSSETLTQSLAATATRAGAAAEETLRKLEATSSEMTERSASQLQAVTEAADRATATLSRMSFELSGSSDAVEKVRGELADLAGWIIKRLEAA